MYKSRGMGNAGTFTTRAHEVVTTGVSGVKLDVKCDHKNL